MFIKKSIMFFVVISSYCINASQEMYPFKKNPELSWSQFEKDFRQTYKH